MTGNARWRAGCLALATVVASAPGADAQSLRVRQPDELPAFEAATVKPADPTRPSPRIVAPDRVHRPVISAMELLTEAYGVQRYRIVGVPDSVTSRRFEVLAKTPRPVTSNDVPPYLQRLLAERFNLKAHVEQRELPLYELTVADRGGRLGPHLTRTTDDCDAIAAERTRNGTVGPPIPRTPGAERAVCMYYVYAMITPGGQRSIRYMSGGSTMAKLADFLSGPAGRVVVDRTGLTGMFDADIQYTLVNTGTGPLTSGGDDPPEIFTAVQEQLGLRLQSGRGPIDVLVVDAINEPTDN